jgi:hypothetical protein
MVDRFETQTRFIGTWLRKTGMKNNGIAAVVPNNHGSYRKKPELSREK